MSVSEAHALAELDADGPLTQRSLGERLQLEKSTVSRLVDQIVERQIAQRQPNPEDGRSVLVVLTAKGQRLAGRLRQARSALFAELIDGMPADDRALVLGGLARLEVAARARR